VPLRPARPDPCGLACLVCAVVLMVGVPRPASAYETQNVILVIIDGPRLSETFEEPGRAHIPRIDTEILPDATHLTEFHNIGLTWTQPGHASVLSGTWQTIANDGSERPTMPTLFEYYRAQTGAPFTDAWVVGGKVKLQKLTYSTHVDYGEQFGAAPSDIDRDDVATYAAFRSVLETFHPRLSMLSLSETDRRAHAGEWQNYLNAIATADSLVGDLWAWLQTDPVYAGKTAMLLTYDHGRHDDAHGGYQHHGDTCAGCQRLGFFAIGPDFKTGIESPLPRTQIDVCRTVALLLGIATPLAVGDTMDEILATPTGLDASLAVDGGVAGGRWIGDLRVAPNPFNPMVRIAFETRRAAFVEVGIHDSLGRFVRRLIAAKQAPGTHTVVWDGRNAAGQALASGAYLVVVDAGSERSVRKIALVR